VAESFSRKEAMNRQNGHRVNYHSMSVLAFVAGMISIALQFLPGWELLAFMLSMGALGGLIGGSEGYEEQDRQKLGRSYKTAFEWLLLIFLFAYAFIELSRWLPVEGTVRFLNGHWPGLLLAMMCAVIGMAGLRIHEELKARPDAR
jgi:hypothetical protein